MLSEALQPPRGYELDQLVATTYSLDLVSLLSIPLTFTSFAVEDADGRLPSDPLLLLEGLRRNGDRITVFCQAGLIAVPLAQRSLYVYLEDSVIATTAPREGGVFHPKLWVARYTSEGNEAIMRVLCMSRNLTGDRSRDTILTLSGVSAADAPDSEPLADLVDWLADRARDAGSSRHVAVRRLANELRSTVFAPPEGF